MPNPVTDDGYNYIYSKLVDDNNDILGIIAYSFYKRQKIEFLRNIQEKHNRCASADELRIFKITSNSEEALESYKVKAEALAREFIDAVLDEQIKEIQNNSDQELIRQVKSIRPTFWWGVAQNAFASLLFVILIGLVMFVAWSSKYGLQQAVEQVMGVNIQEQHPTAPAPSNPPVHEP